MAILRHTRMALTMEIYTQVPDKAVGDALKRLSDQFDADQAAADGPRSQLDQADENIDATPPRPGQADADND
jgi:hypothetical protein